MNQQMTLNILGARRGVMEGKKYASVYISERAADGDKDNMGMLPMKLPCEFEVLDALDPKALPCEVECMVKIKPAAGGKVGMHLMSVKYGKPVTGGKS